MREVGMHFIKSLKDILTDPNSHCSVLVVYFPKSKSSGDRGVPTTLAREFLGQTKSSYEYEPWEKVIQNQNPMPSPEKWRDLLTHEVIVRRELIPFIMQHLTSAEGFVPPRGKRIIFWGVPTLMDQKRRDFNIDGFSCPQLKFVGTVTDRTECCKTLYHNVGMYEFFPASEQDPQQWRMPNLWSYASDIEDPLHVPFHLYKFLNGHHTVIYTDNTETLLSGLTWARDCVGTGRVYLRIFSGEEEPPFYVDICELYEYMMADSALVEKRFHDVIYVFMASCVLSRSSFYPSNNTIQDVSFVPNQKWGFLRIWNWMLEHSEKCKYLIQLTRPHYRSIMEIRDPVLDEDLFALILSEWQKEDAHSIIETEPLPMDDVKIMARTLKYALQYYTNGYRSPYHFKKGAPFDLTMTWEDSSYYGWTWNEEDERLCINRQISFRGMGVPDAYSINMYHNRKRIEEEIRIAKQKGSESKKGRKRFNFVVL